jgi:hypothetical protein
VSPETEIIEVDNDIDNNEFNKIYGVHACGMINRYEGVMKRVSGRKKEKTTKVKEP